MAEWAGEPPAVQVVEGPPPGPGAVVPGTAGRYWRVVRALGSGSCCTVYLVCLEGHQGQEAALKVYHAGDVYEGAQHREVLLLGLIKTVQGQSPHLVEILDNFTYQSQACLVQNLLEGSLRHIIMKTCGHGLSMAAIQRLTKQLLRGVSTLHKVGFVHGDLKPANLLWNPQTACLTIVDFGISFHKDDKRIGKLQSPGYRAPEAERWNQVQMSSTGDSPSSEGGNAQAHSSCRCLQQTAISYTTSARSTLRVACGRHEYSKRSDGDRSHDCRDDEGVNLQSLDEPGPSVGGYDVRDGDIGAGDTQRSDRCREVCGGDSLNPSETTKDLKLGPPSDMWSVACVIMEMVTSKKLFQGAQRQELPGIQETDVKAITRVCQILKETQAESGSKVSNHVWIDLEDLCCRLLNPDPDDRLTADDALHHHFFSHTLVPSQSDLLVMTTRVLRLLDIIPDESSEQLIQDITSDLEEELVKFGRVIQIAAPGQGQGQGKVYVEYESWQSAVAAFESLCRRTFAGRPVLATYFPIDDYMDRNFY